MLGYVPITSKQTSKQANKQTNTMDAAKLNMLAVQLAAATATLAELLGGAPVTKLKTKKSKKDSEAKEPRAPTPWGNFTQRVRALLKTHDLAPKGLETQFCSMLAAPKDGKTKNYDWSDEAILEARKTWVEPPKKAKDEAEEAPEAPKEVAVKPKVAAAPAVATASTAPVEEVDEDKMEANPVKIGGKGYYVNGYGDVFDESDFTYLGAQKGQKIVKGEMPARVKKYLEDANK